MKNSTTALFRISVAIIIIAVIFLSIWKLPNNILSYDVFGYYLYLPMSFIYDDLLVTDVSVLKGILDQYHNSQTLYQISTMGNGTFVMKYSMGLSMFYAPFFFIGWVLALLLDFPADGFSKPFQISVFAGGLIYSVIGLYYLAKVLFHFFKSKITVWVLLAIVFGTNYIIHITYHGQNAMSQNYLFTMYAMVLWYTIQWFEKRDWKSMIIIGIASGLAVVSRPTEILIFFIPFLYGISEPKEIKARFRFIWENRIQVGTMLLISISLVSLQMIYWKWVTGSFIYDSYGANPIENLDLLSPHTWNFLFSFKKGWLIYTPLMAFMVLGFMGVYKRNKSMFWMLLVFTVTNIYIISSWTNWWYAQSFSQRAMVSSYPVCAILLGYAFLEIKNQKTWLKYTLSGLVILFIGLNLFQTLQYDRGVIHGDRMTFDYYKAVFGKLKATDQDRELLLVDRQFKGKEWFRDQHRYDGRVIYEMEPNSIPEVQRYQTADLKHFVALLTPENIYSPIHDIPYGEITDKDHAWIRITARVKPVEETNDLRFRLVTAFFVKGKPYQYRDLSQDDVDLSPDKWTEITFDYLTPEIVFDHCYLRSVFTLDGTSHLLVDDFKIEAFERRD